jgi:hypothetical protein
MYRRKAHPDRATERAAAPFHHESFGTCGGGAVVFLEFTMSPSDVQKAIAEATDRTLAEWLEVGVQRTGPDGMPLVDDDGQPLMRKVNASEMNAILKRLAQLGLTASASSAPASPAGQLIAAMQAATGQPVVPIKPLSLVTPAEDLDDEAA